MRTSTLILLAVLLVAAAPGRAGAEEQPSDAAIRSAFQRGLSYFIEKHVRPAVAQARNGGNLKVKDPKKGVERALGPDVFIEYQLYDLVHFLLHADELGIPRTDPLLQEALEFLVARLDKTTGEWPLWSAEGCLQEKGIEVLARFGKKEEAALALKWLLASPLYHKPGFGEGASGFLIQSWGSPEQSLTNRNYFFDAAFGLGVVRAELTAYGILAALEAGRARNDPLVTENLVVLRRVIAEDREGFDGAISRGLLPMILELMQVHDPAQLKEAAAGIVKSLQDGRCGEGGRDDAYCDGHLLYGLAVLRDLGAQMPVSPIISHKIAASLSAQRADGAWPMKLELPPSWVGKGYFISKLEGSATVAQLIFLRRYFPKAFAPAPSEKRPTP